MLFYTFLSTVKTSAQEIELFLHSEIELDESLSETSGIVVWNGKIWTHNDSGGEAEIYALDFETGKIVQTIRLEDAINYDWEDIALDNSSIYIADTGNNINGARTDLLIYKINLEDIPTSGDAIIPKNKIEIIRFYYPEQGMNPESPGRNNTPFDCEAIVVLDDKIHLFTKDWTSRNSGYASSEYVIPNVPRPNDEKYPAQLLNRHENIGFLVTGADNRKNESLVLIGYQLDAFGAVLVRFYSDFQENNISTGKNQLGIIGNALSLGQVEGICFGNNPSQIYISNELFSFNDFFYPAKIKLFEVEEK